MGIVNRIKNLIFKGKKVDDIYTTQEFNELINEKTDDIEVTDMEVATDEFDDSTVPERLTYYCDLLGVTSVELLDANDPKWETEIVNLESLGNIIHLFTDSRSEWWNTPHSLMKVTMIDRDLSESNIEVFIIITTVLNPNDQLSKIEVHVVSHDKLYLEYLKDSYSRAPEVIKEFIKNNAL